MLRAFIESIILGCVAILIALAGNVVSPHGIPLFGHWDPKVGSVHAGGICQPQTNEITEETVSNVYIDPEYLFIDSRNSEEYMSGHIPRAVSLPLGEFEERFEDFHFQFSPDIKLVVYCSGIECHDANDLSQKLKEAGYQNVYLYARGYEGWIEANRPVKTGLEP